MEIAAFLADSVVSAEGKLFVQGAGWNVLNAAGFPVRHPRIGIGVLVRVPYTATNQVHRLEVRMITADGEPVSLGDAPPEVGAPDGKLYVLGGEFSVGRPP